MKASEKHGVHGVWFFLLERGIHVFIPQNNRKKKGRGERKEQKSMTELAKSMSE